MDESRIADPSSALRRSDRSLPTRLSRAVSVVLHPLVMPLYVILLLVTGPTQLSYFPASVKFYLLWVTVLYTAVIPLLSVGLLRSVGRISSLAIDDRRERILPVSYTHLRAHETVPSATCSAPLRWRGFLRR